MNVKTARRGTVSRGERKPFANENSTVEYRETATTDKIIVRNPILPEYSLDIFSASRSNFLYKLMSILT
tara:strand:- start:36 stop:242 length:207 start_codon:yes stop_codon:yes gene_type:complete